MKKQIFMWILGIILAVISIEESYAETRIHVASVETQNITYRNQILVHYNQNEFTSIKGGEGVNFWAEYSCPDISLQDYNEKYSNHPISNITLRFIYSPAQKNQDGSTTFLSQQNETITLTNMTMPFPQRKKFFTIFDKETVLITMDTNYANSTFNRDTICRFDVFLGTEGCDRCREIDYFEFEQDVVEADAVQGFNQNIRLRIKQFFELNYEFALMIYWIAIIAVLLFSISAIFYAIFSLYHFINH